MIPGVTNSRVWQTQLPPTLLTLLGLPQMEYQTLLNHPAGGAIYFLQDLSAATIPWADRFQRPQF